MLLAITRHGGLAWRDAYGQRRTAGRIGQGRGFRRRDSSRDGGAGQGRTTGCTHAGLAVTGKGVGSDCLYTYSRAGQADQKKCRLTAGPVSVDRSPRRGRGLKRTHDAEHANAGWPGSDRAPGPGSRFVGNGNGESGMRLVSPRPSHAGRRPPIACSRPLARPSTCWVLEDTGVDVGWRGPRVRTRRLETSTGRDFWNPACAWPNKQPPPRPACGVHAYIRSPQKPTARGAARLARMHQPQSAGARPRYARRRRFITVTAAVSSSPCR